MNIQDLITRVATARNNLQEVRNQILTGDRRDVGITRHQLSQTDYDRDRAVRYAAEYARNPNPQYIVYESDCTNFATQVLIEGGVIDYETARDPDGTSLFAKENWDPDNWGSQKRRLDTPFIRAAELPQYLEDQGLASLKPVDPVSKEAVHAEIRRSLKPGDLIAYELDDDSDADHINVFLGFNEEGVPMVANHSPGKITEVKWDSVKTLVPINS